MTTRIEADLLIPGAGEPLRNGCVIIDGSTIVYAGPLEGAPPGSSSDVTVQAPAVLPGLWDSHCHFTGSLSLNPDEYTRTSPLVLIARATLEAGKALRAGFTSVRELGGFGIFLARAVNEGSIPGPHIYSAGTMLSPTAGHGDAHFYPVDFVRGQSERLGLPGPCDGVPECLRAVRWVLRNGASVVKICTSGGVLSDLDSPIHQQFSDEEIRAMVEEARRADRVVAAHCHGKPGILAALRTGVYTIEHGSYLDEETAELMAKAGLTLVPTRFIVTQLARIGTTTGLPEHQYAKLKGLVEVSRKALRIAVQKKVRIALGTDIGGSTPEMGVPWGANAQELRLLVEDGGMSPLQAIEAATANGPLTLGPQAPRSGQLKAGFVADVLAVRDNPLSNLSILEESANISHVWKDGKLVVQNPPK